MPDPKYEYSDEEAKFYAKRHDGRWPPGYIPKEPEDRIRLGLGTRADSMKVGLLPKIGTLTERERADSRIKKGLGTRSDSIAAKYLPEPEAPKYGLLTSEQQRQTQLVEGGLKPKATAPKEPTEKYGKLPWWMNPEVPDSTRQKHEKKALAGKSLEQQLEYWMKLKKLTIDFRGEVFADFQSQHARANRNIARIEKEMDKRVTAKPLREKSRTPARLDVGVRQRYPMGLFTKPKKKTKPKLEY